MVRTEHGRLVRVGQLSRSLACVETGTTPITDDPSSLQARRLIWRLYEAEEQGIVADLIGLGLDDYHA